MSAIKIKYPAPPKWLIKMYNNIYSFPDVKLDWGDKINKLLQEGYSRGYKDALSLTAWKPFKYAPKDGRKFIVRWESKDSLLGTTYSYDFACWSSVDKVYYSNTTTEEIAINPTHFKIL